MDPRARIAQLTQMLSDADARARLTQDELAAIEAEMAQLWADIRSGSVDGIGSTDTEVLQPLRDARIACAAEMRARSALAAEDEASIAAMEADIASAASTEASADGEAEAGGEGTEGAGDGSEGEGTTEGAGDDAAEEGTEGAGTEGEGAEAGVLQASARQPVALPTIAELNARTPRRDTPHVTVGERQGADVRWVPTNEMLTREEFITRLAAYPETMAGFMPEGQKVVLGQIRTISEHAQQLDDRLDSPETIARKLELTVAGSLDPRNWRDGGMPAEALLASGGWGTPAPVVYDVPQISSAVRPVRNALPSIGATRGGLTWVPAPKFSDIVTGGPTNTGAAVGVWTNAIDTTPGATVKSHQTIPASTSRTVQLDALYQYLQEGVLQSRAFPEWVRAWMLNTDAAWARMAETYLLDKIEASSIVKFATQQITIGAARDILFNTINLAAQERNRQRMAPDAMVRCLYPSLLIDLVQGDLVRSGTNFVDSSPLVVARNWIDTQFRNANINGSVYIDSSTTGGQLSTTQASHAHLNAFPSIIRTYLFHEGAFVVGDGGTENIGVVRDSTLVNTNDFRIFSESFEGLFDRGIWGYVLDSYLCPDGTASAAKDISKLCVGS